MDAAEMRTRLETAVSDFNQSFGDEDARERYFDFYAQDVALHGYPPGVEGHDGARAFYTALWAALPDGSIALEDLVAEGDTAAARFVLRGTHTGGELMGVPASGAAVEVDAQSFFRFNDEGRLAERWQALDALTLLTQIGAIPAPA
jgi:predicted ester cyclase